MKRIMIFATGFVAGLVPFEYAVLAAILWIGFTFARYVDERKER